MISQTGIDINVGGNKKLIGHTSNVGGEGIDVGGADCGGFASPRFSTPTEIGPSYNTHKSGAQANLPFSLPNDHRSQTNTPLRASFTDCAINDFHPLESEADDTLA